MGFFNFDLRRALTLIVLLALPLISIQLQQASGKDPWIFKPFLLMSGSSQSFYSSFSHGVQDATDLYLNLIQIKKENRRLKEELQKIQMDTLKMNELRIENERYAKLLDFSERVPMDLMPARIIGRDILPEYQSLMIDRGTKNGLKKGMSVITAAGAVGYISHVESQFAHILLLTDRYAVVDALIQRSRARGILGGRGDIDYELKYLRRSDDVQVGDQVVTSGLDNIFPKGLPIGTVVSVEKSEYGFEQIVRVNPSIESDHLEEVFVVRNAKNYDLETAINPPAATTPQNEGPKEKEN